MGPGAGTAVLAGTGLGFANVPSAPASGAAVGVVAAAGTGAQEVVGAARPLGRARSRR